MELAFWRMVCWRQREEGLEGKPGFGELECASFADASQRWIENLGGTRRLKVTLNITRRAEALGSHGRF